MGIIKTIFSVLALILVLAIILGFLWVNNLMNVEKPDCSNLSLSDFLAQNPEVRYVGYLVDNQTGDWCYADDTGFKCPLYKNKSEVE